jgi:hypothetical protein
MPAVFAFVVPGAWVSSRDSDGRSANDVEESGLVARKNQAARYHAESLLIQLRDGGQIGSDIGRRDAFLAQVQMRKSVRSQFLSGRGEDLTHQSGRKMEMPVRIQIGISTFHTQGIVFVAGGGGRPSEIFIPALAGERSDRRPSGPNMVPCEEF